MEKFAKAAGKFFGIGLLVFILSSPKVFAERTKRFAAATAAKLLVEPESDAIFTNQEARFFLRIPNITSADAQVDLPRFPEGVVFNSSRMEDYILSHEGKNEYTGEHKELGTQFEFVFTFEKAGQFDLPPLTLYLADGRYSVKFKSVQVYQNPMTILPRVVLAFKGGPTIFGGEKSVQKFSLVAGKAAHFTVYLQYAVQLQQFAWSIPKDSIFKELKRYEIESKFKKNNANGKPRFSTERIAIADFEWIPLTEEQTVLPDIKLMVTSYSGQTLYLTMPECVVEILPSTENSASQENENFFAYAFAQEENAEEDIDTPSFDVSTLLKIAQLRSVERHSFLQNAVRVQRIAAEEECGIQNSEDEPSLPIFVLFLSIFILLLAAALVLFFVRKKILAVFVAVLSIIFLFLTVLSSQKLFERYAIVTGGTLCPVPEDSALTKTAAGVGSRVRVRQEIQDWYYVERNESGGWIKKENLVLIK